MRSILHAAAAVAVIGSGLGFGGPASATVPVTGDPVLFWNEVLITGLAGSPTVTSRGYAMVDVALHDAVNATVGKPNFSYLGNIPTSGGDTRAAASVAARDVLAYLNPAKVADFDAALAASLALIPNGPAKTAGMATGAKIALATIANRATDGSSAVVPYTPTGLPGNYALTGAPAAVPQWAYVDPWHLTSVDQYRPPAPPALGSAEYAAAFNLVKDIGAAGSLTRTADQTASAQFWAGAAGTGTWLRAAIDAAEAKGLSSLENASIMALLSTSVADAVISVWDAKYYYDFWRPITGIQNGGLDGNGATIGDPTWTSLIGAPPHPSYMSGHSAVAGAAAGILKASFGAGAPFCLTASGATRCWSNYDDAATDAANSRLWGGIHWSFDNDAALAAGYAIAQYATYVDAFTPVPEPATWTMMITGFGLAGAFLRRRPRRPSAEGGSPPPWGQSRAGRA